MKTLFKIFISASCLLIGFSSCHQRGCTDSKAINFDVTADEDDGSCILCDDEFVKSDSEIVDLVDKKFGSPYFNQHVARFYLYQYIKDPTDDACADAKSTINLTIKNLVPQNMYLSYRVLEISGPIDIFYTDLVDLHVNETVDVGVIETLNNPPFFKISLDSIQANTSSDIIYY